MPIQIPNLDNKTFDNLIKELIASIPQYSRSWTGFNYSDPGITILELLAWISENMIYRANTIPDKTYINFLKLLAGSSENVYDKSDKERNVLLEYINKIDEDKQNFSLQLSMSAAQSYINSQYRVITEQDYIAHTKKVDECIKRVKINTANNIIEVVLTTDSNAIVPEGLIEKVHNYLKPRALIGTILKVRMSKYTPVTLSISIECENYANTAILGKQSKDYTPNDKFDGDNVEGLAAKQVFTYIDSIKGGSDGKGWVYGRKLVVYELFNVIEKVDSVHHVNSIKQVLGPGNIVAFEEIKIDELIKLEKLTIEVIKPRL